VTEGPTAKLIAERITKEFGGEVIIDTLSKSKKLRDPKEIIGRVFVKATTVGKNIFLLLVPEYVVRLHLMMWGSVHIYAINEQLTKPQRFVRLMLIGKRKKLVVYNAPIVENVNVKTYNSWKEILDPLNNWDERKALVLVKKHKEEVIESVLLNQRVIAGVGNIIKNEVLFRSKVHPYSRVKNIPGAKLRSIVRNVYEVSKLFYERKKSGKWLRPILFVYRRHGKLCKVCGGVIKLFRSEFTGRINFVCENCQKVY